MKVLLIGSKRHIEDAEMVRVFEDSCRSIGRVLSDRKAEILLVSGSGSTVDPYVAAGANSSSFGAKLALFSPDAETIAADDGRSIGVFDQAQYPNAEIRKREIDGGWRVVHLRALSDCDVVIAVGGSPTGTGTVVYSAEVLGKPVVLVPTLGGSAKNAWRDLKRYYTPEQRQMLQAVPDGSLAWAQHVVNAAFAIEHRNPFVTISSRRIAVYLASIVAAFFGWFGVYSLDKVILPGWFEVGMMLFLASVVGSLARASLESTGYLRPIAGARNPLSILLTGVSVSLAVFFLPQGAVQILNGGALPIDSVESVRRIGLALSTLAFFASVFVERVVDRLRDQFNKLF